MKILIVSGFFESELPSYREHAYARGLAQLGHEVTLMCGDQSQIWHRRANGMRVTNPAAKDEEFMASTGVKVLRRRVRLRYSDFVAYLPALSAIRAADVVHIIEFRTGTTALIAALAKLFGKPVVYDHEQRGDRDRHWTSRVDSVLRRQMIRFGAMFVDHVRHTVIQNLRHFRRCSASKAPTQLAPLGADPAMFGYSADARSRLRAKHGIGESERVAIISGKLHPLKLVDQVVLAARKAGVRLMLVGMISDDMRAILDKLPPGDEIHVPYIDSAGLAEYYACADVAVFTTFTLSYWEAYTTGIQLVVPRTAFSELAFAADPSVRLFGGEELFVTPDEQYVAGAQIVDLLADALRALSSPTDRRTNAKFASSEQIKKLEKVYVGLVQAHC